MTDPLRPLLGTNALVTGGSRRIGRATCERLARAGASVVVHHHRDRAGARETVAALEARGARAVALAADLADADACVRLVEEAETALGPLGLLVNNAGRFERTPLATLGAEDFDRHMAVNGRAVYLLCLEAGRRMKERGRGAIVSLADVAGIRPWPGYVPYSASKAVVVSLTLSFARALAPQVRVNALAPGPILPPEGTSPEARDQVAATTLLGRWGRPEDVAEAVLFLAVHPYVTGVVLPVDGGRLASGR